MNWKKVTAMFPTSPRWTLFGGFGALILVAVSAAWYAGYSSGNREGLFDAKPLQAAVGWSEHLIEHTAGEISRESDIRIRFARDIQPKGTLAPALGRLVTVSPPISGTAKFVTPRELVLSQPGGLKPGTRYSVLLDPRPSKRLPDALGPYRFYFDVMKQDFEIQFDGPVIADPDGRTVRVTGEIRTADRAKEEDIAAMLKASLEGRPQLVKWTHEPGGRLHRFETGPIERPKSEAALIFTWDGSYIGAGRQGLKKVQVTRRGRFRVVSVKLNTKGKTVVTIGFSETLDASQDLTGMIQIGRAKIRTEISGNLVTAYIVSPIVGLRTLTVSAGVLSKAGGSLRRPYRRRIRFRRKPPQVKFAGSGVILPGGDRLEVPIEAINVGSAQITAFKIYEDNIGQFLQNNKLAGNRRLARVGRYLWRRTIKFPKARRDLWSRYTLDVTQLAAEHPGAILRLTVSINRGNSLLLCKAADRAVPVPPDPPLVDLDSPNERSRSSWDFAQSYLTGASAGTNYRDRNNPCKDSYFRYQKSKVRSIRNFMASNIGLMAKAGSDGSFLALATNIRTGQPLANVILEVRNFQNQALATLTTGTDGLARYKLKATPYYLFAQKDGQKGYLKISRGTALPISHFDAGGEAVKGGVKGFLFGERGVWRPGDDLHLTLVLHDPDDAIPDDHPAGLQLINPAGQVVVTRTNRNPVDGFYTFTVSTPENAPTGDWTVKAFVGDKTFQRTVKIETVIPNRLSATLTPGNDGVIQAKLDIPYQLESAWLHGAKASKLKADVKLWLSSKTTRFTRFQDFTFDDPARVFEAQPIEMWRGRLDTEGKASFRYRVRLSSKPAGHLQAIFETRVFEESGAFTKVLSKAPFQPYDRYVGLRMPKGDATRNMLLTDVEHTVELAALSSKGDPAGIRRVHLTLYKVRWKWWWDKSADSMSQYASEKHRSRVKTGTARLVNGRGKWNFQIKYPQWGRYLLRVCDREGGHCAGKVFYIDWPGWAGRAQESSGPAASVLTMITDKKRYTVGDTAVIELPDGVKGRALMTLENGSRILRSRWLSFDGGRRPTVRVPITGGMAPNVYVSITLLQPHAKRGNDRPIRLYGVTPLLVEDPKTRLTPKIQAASSWEPLGQRTVAISEGNGRPMTYTLAVVDEGLLSLTGFKTPNLHGRFYRREALGVLTWDLFDQVVGAYGADLEKLISIGGGFSEEALGLGQPKERRFPPLVRFYGPFRLKAGQKREHLIDLPQYVGAVRVMTVAGLKSSYGIAEQSIQVKSPISLAVTLPRVLGPGEEFDMPVEVFAYDENVKRVTLTVEPGPGLTIVGRKTMVVEIPKSRNISQVFAVTVANQAGPTHMIVRARGGGRKTETRVAIVIRVPNAPETRSVSRRIAPGQTWQPKVKLHGMKGTNSTTLSVSSIPPFGLDRRLDYLVRFPYGCLEQTTSGAFPQVYLPKLVQMEAKKAAEVENNVHGGIERLKSFQTGNGAFSYWPGQSQINHWADAYAGHFLVEAKRAGYSVPPRMLKSWMARNAIFARASRPGNQAAADTLAYRLLVLALANQSNIGAMNRLRRNRLLSKTGRWLLAGAYAQIGEQGAVSSLLSSGSALLAEYRDPGPTFGSLMRDAAILLQAFILAGEETRATELAQDLADELSGRQWYSTQSLGFALSSLGRYVLDRKGGQPLSFSHAVGMGDFKSVTSRKSLAAVTIPASADGKELFVRNSSNRTLYATLTTVGIAPPGAERPKQGKLGISVKYQLSNGAPTGIDKLSQGKDLVAVIRVRNGSSRKIENLALKYIVPSGWEIAEGRLTGKRKSRRAYDYRDIRDDRVSTHFSLRRGESRTFRLRFTTAYAGRFYAPGIVFEDMYDAELSSRTAGQWVEVIAP